MFFSVHFGALAQAFERFGRMLAGKQFQAFSRCFAFLAAAALRVVEGFFCVRVTVNANVNAFAGAYVLAFRCADFSYLFLYLTSCELRRVTSGSFRCLEQFEGFGDKRIGEVFYIVRTCCRIDYFVEVAFFLKKVRYVQSYAGRERSRIFECRVVRSYRQCVHTAKYGGHSFGGRTEHIHIGVVFGNGPYGRFCAYFDRFGVQTGVVKGFQFYP